jgi:hypothetical protein
MDLKGVVRAGAWTIGGLVALVVAAYLVFVVINWNDEAPSADAERMVASERDRPAVADEANAYVHLLGLAAAPETDPVALGRERKAWMEGFDPSAGASGVSEMPGTDANWRAARPQAAADLVSACPGVACVEALRANPEALDQWLASEQWLLDRYRRMLSVPAWRETVPRDPRAPMAGFAPALDAQSLHLLEARQHAVAGDADIVCSLLEQDLAFWRRVLASSDLLLTKMVAAAAVRRHFELGGLALRELPSGTVDQSIPPSWRRAMSGAERSLSRALAGEWHYSADFLATDASIEALLPQVSTWDRLSARLLRPGFQPKATLNLGAARKVHWAVVSERPYPELGQAIDAARREQAEDQRLFRLYNPVGTLLDSVAAGSGYADYVARANDVEGMRRVALLAAAMREAGVQPADADGFVRGSDLRNPYNGEPFEWDAATGSVVFRGLAHGEKGPFAVPL